MQVRSAPPAYLLEFEADCTAVPEVFDGYRVFPGFAWVKWMFRLLSIGPKKGLECNAILHYFGISKERGP
jgi:hypothetical protein